MLIVSAGFAIFGLSAFPPTQRFGISIVLGTILASVSTVFVLPLLAEAKMKREKSEPEIQEPVIPVAESEDLDKDLDTVSAT
jgi:predicted RND superfamily exporter protein